MSDNCELVFKWCNGSTQLALLSILFEMEGLSDIWEVSGVPSLSEKMATLQNKTEKWEVSVPPESCLFMQSLLFMRTCL